MGMAGAASIGSGKMRAGIAGPSEQMIMHEPVKRSRLLATAGVNLVVLTQADHVEVCVGLDCSRQCSWWPLSRRAPTQLAGTTPMGLATDTGLGPRHFIAAGRGSN